MSKALGSDPLEEVASNLGHKRVTKSAHMKQQSKILAFRWASESECTWGWLQTSQDSQAQPMITTGYTNTKMMGPTIIIETYA